jgi:GH24 family phage-related lysozyme (muramidase)
MFNTSEYLPKLKEFEGSVPYMYLDTAGNVTVGVGNLLPDSAAARKLPFEWPPDPSAEPPVAAARPATADEIQADFDTVSKQPPGRGLHYYQQVTRLRLPEAAIDAVLESRVAEFSASLTASFPDFTLYPEGVCAALFDMAFNLGLHKLTSGFPTFTNAVRARDWTTAARECRRGGIGERRNVWTRAQFEQAAGTAQAAAGGR